jgi:hypothetical protein
VKNKKQIKQKTITKFLFVFFLYKIIVLRDTGQFHSDLDQTTHMHTHTVRMDTDKSQLFLKVIFFSGCAKSNRPGPDQQISIVACCSLSTAYGRMEFLSSHKPQTSHIGLYHLD